MALVLGTNCGFVSAAPSVDPGGSDYEFDGRAAALKAVSPATATKVTEIGVWIDNATEEANLEFAIYTHNVGDDEPEAIVSGKINIAKGTSAGWKKQSCNIAISPETIYWIAAQLDSTATNSNANYGDDTGEKWDVKTSQTELTDPWGTSTVTYDNKIFGVYAVWEAAAGPSQTILDYERATRGTNRGLVRGAA